MTTAVAETGRRRTVKVMAHRPDPYRENAPWTPSELRELIEAKPRARRFLRDDSGVLYILRRALATAVSVEERLTNLLTEIEHLKHRNQELEHPTTRAEPVAAKQVQRLRLENQILWAIATTVRAGGNLPPDLEHLFDQLDALTVSDTR